MPPLGIGFIGSGFNARFHMLAFQGFATPNVLGVWSPNYDARRARRRRWRGGSTSARPAPTARSARWWRILRIDAIWLCGANHARIENVEEIVDAIDARHGRAARGSHARSRWPAMSPRPSGSPRLVKRRRPAAWIPREPGLRAPGGAGHGAALGTRRRTHRPALPRARRGRAQRSPHAPGSGRAQLQGGGVLNDMMCHSALVVRHLLTKPGKPPR